MSSALFTLQIHSVVDLITNSSSELFVGTYDSKKTLIVLLENIYPDYLSEYEQLKNIDELSMNELAEYVYCRYQHYDTNNTPVNVISEFTTDDMFEEPEYGWVYVKENFVRNNFDKIIKNIDPENNLIFLYSVDDNPNWSMQEKLMKIMTRYHLG
jgi:hypothetical protein